MSKQFPWVADGIYDHREYLVRYRIADGGVAKVISKMWLDKGGPEGCSPEELQPWGVHPDFPPRPAAR